MTDKIRIVSYVEEEIYKDLKKISENEKRTMSNLLEIILTEYIKENKKRD